MIVAIDGPAGSGKARAARAVAAALRAEGAAEPDGVRGRGPRGGSARRSRKVLVEQ